MPGGFLQCPQAAQGGPPPGKEVLGGTGVHYAKTPHCLLAAAVPVLPPIHQHLLFDAKVVHQPASSDFHQVFGFPTAMGGDGRSASHRERCWHQLEHHLDEECSGHWLRQGEGESEEVVGVKQQHCCSFHRLENPRHAGAVLRCPGPRFQTSAPGTETAPIPLVLPPTGCHWHLLPACPTCSSSPGTA